jgi:hypothetical protein
MTRIFELSEAHLDIAIDLLTEGFNRKRSYWENAIERLRSRPTPDGLPRFGYGIEHETALVGVLLTITTQIGRNVRCNLSSWYVRPSFRHLAPMLAQRPLKHHHVTMFNVSPARHTWSILQAQGYSRFSSGRLACIPLLSRDSGAYAFSYRSKAHYSCALPEFEKIILDDHESYGCLTVIVETISGKILPFVLGRRHRYGIPAAAHLVYCRDIHDFVEHAHVIGRFLSNHALFFVLTDALGPVKGLFGLFRKDLPRYRRGNDDQIRLGDVAYSEQVVFGDC